MNRDSDTRPVPGPETVADIETITRYLQLSLTAEERAVVEERLRGDPRFWKLALPLAEAWDARGRTREDESTEKGFTPVLEPAPPPVVRAPIVVRPRPRRRRLIYGLLPLIAAAAIVGWVFRDVGAPPPRGVAVDPRDAALDSAAARAAERTRAMERADDPALTLELMTRRVRAPVFPVGDVRFLFRNAYRAETGRNETRVEALPGGSTVLLYPESSLLFSGDSARTMRGFLSGEGVLDVPAGTSLQVQTASASFTVGPGRYAVRSWRRDAGTAISIERGGVYALGDSVVGTQVFALITLEPMSIRQVQDGRGFPIPIAPETDR